MSDPQTILTDRFTRALAAIGDDCAGADPMIRPAGNPKFGDYQANAAMALAKKVGSKPRDLAQQIVEHLDVDDICERTEIAGPGFINIHLRETFLDDQLSSLARDTQLGVTQADPPLTVVIDYSSPNVAKEMHVGHLRSTVIGDAIARVLEAQGHTVIRQNHLGDWGTQFGMLIEHLLDAGYDLTGDHAISDLNALYQAAKKAFDDDEGFATRARARVVKLQQGDEETLKLWHLLIDESKAHFNEVYHRLGISLSDDDIRGESFYNPHLADVVNQLEADGLLQESRGASVVFPEGFTDSDGNPLPMIVRKSDGGFLYATTDLAAARYRIGELHADRMIYVTDARQAGHFAMVFWTLRESNWATDRVRLDHVPFGMVLGKDNKPFKTREGGTVRLTDLLDEAEQRAAATIAEKNPDLPDAAREAVARAVGIGALKYADLSSDRIKDYVFDWDRMLSFDGNTAPYLQYSYARIQSIFRKGEVQPHEVSSLPMQIREPAERALALQLLQLPGVVDSVADSLEPHRLCNYLYDLAAAFHRFFEQCPVLKADDGATRNSRLALCALVAKVLEKGLGLLGIDAVDRM